MGCCVNIKIAEPMNKRETSAGTIKIDRLVVEEKAGFDGGGKIMERDKKEKIRCICFLLASISFFIVSIVNFMDKNTTPAIPYLLLGISFLLLSTANLRKNK